MLERNIHFPNAITYHARRLVRYVLGFNHGNKKSMIETSRHEEMSCAMRVYLWLKSASSGMPNRAGAWSQRYPFKVAFSSEIIISNKVETETIRYDRCTSP